MPACLCAGAPFPGAEWWRLGTSFLQRADACPVPAFTPGCGPYPGSCQPGPGTLQPRRDPRGCFGGTPWPSSSRAVSCHSSIVWVWQKASLLSLTLSASCSSPPDPQKIKYKVLLNWGIKTDCLGQKLHFDIFLEAVWDQGETESLGDGLSISLVLGFQKPPRSVCLGEVHPSENPWLRYARYCYLGNCVFCKCNTLWPCL